MTRVQTILFPLCEGKVNEPKRKRNTGLIDQARRKFFSSDVAGKKEDRIRDYSELNQIICPGLCNLIYPAILHENYDLLAKRRRNRFIIPLQLSQECENELMPCSDRSKMYSDK